MEIWASAASVASACRHFWGAGTFGAPVQVGVGVSRRIRHHPPANSDSCGATVETKTAAQAEGITIIGEFVEAETGKGE